MQTFLPYPDFAASVATLDTPRLGKQRVETLQILRALSFPDYGWRNHPAVLMWRGRRPALVAYGLAGVAEWRRRGFGDSTAAQIAEFAPEVVGRTQDELAQADLLPSWLGTEQLHRSHQSRLVAKDPDFYAARFPEAPDGLDYLWPGPDGEEPDPVGPPDLWVLRPDSTPALGQFLELGIIGLGPAGFADDATGLDLLALRERLGPVGRRKPSKALLALAGFVVDVGVGDELAVPIADGRSLLVGTVLGDYEFGDGPLPHRRRIGYTTVLPRSQVSPTWTLQDVRPLFRVRSARAMSGVSLDR